MESMGWDAVEGKLSDSTLLQRWVKDRAKMDK